MMDVLAGILGTVLLMLGLIVFSCKKAFDIVALDAKVAYQRAGRIWLVGGFVQGKIRSLYKEFGENVFQKESPEEKKQAEERHVRSWVNKRKRNKEEL